MSTTTTDEMEARLLSYLDNPHGTRRSGFGHRGLLGIALGFVVIMTMLGMLVS